MLKINCNICGKELEEKGGLIFSPPPKYGKQMIRKYHVCSKCWYKVEDFLKYF